MIDMATEVTKERIIEAAIDEFADVGYEKATIRNISARAGVNQAAINYHFSSKSELYRQVFETVFQDCRDNRGFPPGDGINSARKLESALRQWIEYFMVSVFENEDSEDPRIYRLKLHEIFNPSEMHDELLDKYLSQDLIPLKKIITAGLPPDTAKADILIKVFSLLGKCFFYALHRRIITRFSGTENFGKKNRSKIIDEIFKESMSGLRYSGLKP